MVVNKPILQDIEYENQKIKTILLQNASSVHFWCAWPQKRQSGTPPSTTWMYTSEFFQTIQ